MRKVKRKLESKIKPSEKKVEEDAVESENQKVKSAVPDIVEAFVIEKPNIKDDEKKESDEEVDTDDDDPEELDKLKKYLLKRSQNK